MSRISDLYQRKQALLGIDIAALSDRELRDTLQRILDQKIHGLCFSPYGVGQAPGSPLSDQQILSRLQPLVANTKWIRSFSCTQGNERIPALAKEQGLKTLVGVWLDDDLDNNEEELARGIELAAAGQVDILAIGNEVLLRGDLTEDALIYYINKAKAACPGIPVGYVDAYFKFDECPRVTEACDVILANCYPFWEGCPSKYALLYMKDMYRRTQAIAGGKKVIISETGWPNAGTAFGEAEPSELDAIRYFLNSMQWAAEEQIEIFYFSAYDEAWKVDKEGDVGAYWGLWDQDGHFKFG